MSGKYHLACLECGERYEDRFTGTCPAGHDALLRTVYEKKRIDVSPFPGIFRFLDWLPVEEAFPTDAGPVTFQSGPLAKELGLSRLYVTFSGYWPERGGQVATCSFKELEAIPTVRRLQEKGKGVLVIASAGNTGRAFCQVSALTGVPVVVVVPEKAVHRIWTTVPSRHAFLIAVEGDYSDAIAVGNLLVRDPPFIAEGGVRNVARRDGMGTVMLDAALAIGRMPDHYFQAVGSGTGGIAAWEAAIRLREDGRFGAAIPRLHLSQNLPFVPMVSAWRERRRTISPERDMPDARNAVDQVFSDVLTNRNPPYAVRGGVYDALTDSGGEMYAVSNSEAVSAGDMFAALEGIDLDPAAAVCTASLVQARDRGYLKDGEVVHLNITGGGYELVKEKAEIRQVTVAYTMRAGEDTSTLIAGLRGWSRSHA